MCIILLITQKWGVRSFKLEILLLAVYVTQKDRVSQYCIYKYLTTDNLYYVDGGSNNDVTDRKYVFHIFFKQNGEGGGEDGGSGQNRKLLILFTGVLTVCRENSI